MRISPKKAREVARILPGKKAAEAVEILKYIPRKAAPCLTRLKISDANAKYSNLSADDLYIWEAIWMRGQHLSVFDLVLEGLLIPTKRMSHL